jgi:hypothetical protein
MIDKQDQSMKNESKAPPQPFIYKNGEWMSHSTPSFKSNRFYNS